MKTNNQIQKKNPDMDLLKKEKISTENLLLFLNMNVLEKYCTQTFELYSSLFGIKKWSLFIFLFAAGTSVSAQDLIKKSTTKPSVTVLNVDTKGLDADPVQMGNMVRLELEKLDTFEVMDRYDVSYVVEKNQLNINNCYGKICLVEVGTLIKSDKMLTGSVELFGETIVITLRLIDVKTATIERTQVNEFVNLPKELQSMVRISIDKMFGRPLDETLVMYLTKRNSYESATNNPNQTKVDLGGPRSGFAYFSGAAGKRLQAPKNQGGYASYPVMFQFGYQYEIQYLNEGDYQALFEFLPTLTGFNQNVFIPSLTIMNGFRDNKHGWELAFGPTFGFVKKANGYYDGDRNWHLASEWTEPWTNPNKIEKQLDRRGHVEIQAGFIVAIGKTFKSGKLNMPVNFYIVPNKEGIRVGASFGFNAKRK